MGTDSLPRGRYLVVGPDAYVRILGVGTHTDPGLTPSAPTAVSATDGQGGGLVAWAPPETSASPVLAYRVRWALASAPESFLGTTPDLSPSADGTTLTLSAGFYSADVSARNSSGWGAWSTRVTFTAEEGTPEQVPPLEPRTLAVTRTSAGTYRLTWQAPTTSSPGHTGYEHQLDGAGTTTAPATAVAATRTGVADGSHTWRIRATNGLGASPWASVTFAAAEDTPPAPPTGVGVSPTYDGGIVTWTASATPGVSRYDLAVDDGLKTASVSAGTQLRQPFTGLQPGPHSVTVRAVDAAGRVSVAASATWSVQADTGSVLEYRVSVGSDNRAGFRTAQQNAIAQGKPLRVVGGLGRLDGTAYWLDELTDLRFETGAGFKQYGDPQGSFVRMGGGFSTTTWTVTGGMARDQDTVTLANTSGLAVGDWIVADADVKYSHKDTYASFTRRIVSIVGNTVQVHLPWHRDRAGQSARVRLSYLGRPATAQGGVFEHASFKTAKGHDLVNVLGCQGVVWTGLEPRRGPGTGLKTAFGVGNYFEVFAHQLRNSPSQFQYGYGVCDEGDLESEYRIRSTACRHAWTTDQTNHLSAHGNYGLLTGRGECEAARVILDVWDMICTGFNDHEPGWRIRYEGNVRTTGTVAKGTQIEANGVSGATNTNDPTGGFIRSRGAYIGPAGLNLYDLNSHGAQDWYAAFTVADIATKMQEQGYTSWGIADAPELGPGPLRIGTQGLSDIRCKDALSIKQPAKLTNVTIFGPVDVGIDMDSPYGTGEASQRTGSVRIERAGVGVADSNLLTGASGITFVNCSTNLA